MSGRNCVSSLTVVLLLAACATPRQHNEQDLYKEVVKELSNRAVPHVGTLKLAQNIQNQEAASGKAAAENVRIHQGTGVLVKPPRAPEAATQTPSASGEVSLNYEGADLREVIRTILGDILGENYIIDPQVTGTVNIRTTRGVPRSALIATLETLCRMNGAALVKEGALYKVLPAANVIRGSVTPQLGGGAQPLTPGYKVVLVPLKYIGIGEMVRVLEPFVKDANSIRPDPLRNMLVLSGTEQELQHLIETVDMFDIDWMAGMSVGIFTLKSADVKTVYSEIVNIVGDKNTGPLAGIVRIIPIERMNALLVITPQPHYLEQAKLWVERLDKGGDDTGTQLFVYHVQNGRAEKLAPLIMQAFTGRAAPQTTTPVKQPQVAPGLTPGSIFSQPQMTQPVTPQQQQPAPITPPGAQTGPGSGISTAVSRNVQIIADKDNNALLIMATPAEYSVIEAALRKLDLLPKQVMIEVMIAEVQLTGDLSFGVEWYFSHGARQAGGLFRNGTAPGNVFNPTSSASGAGIGPRVPGFNYLWQNSNFPGGVGAALTLLDNAGKTRVLSNPHIMAIDNITSKIQVGTRVPINQQTIVGGTTSAVTTTQQYLDTGVALTVTPHITSSGSVSMDFAVEYSTVPAGADIASGAAPPVNSRSQQTTVVVQSGETLVIGGLITENNSTSTSGIPLLSRIPVIGAAFGNQEFKNDRTELMLIITPKVVADEHQARAISDELRQKMHHLDEVAFPPQKKGATPPGLPEGPRP